MVILCRSPSVTRSRDIKRRLDNRLNLWEKNAFQTLVEGTVRQLTASLTTARATAPTAEQRTRIFNRKMLRGDLRGAVRYIMARETGTVLAPDQEVANALEAKHPEPRVPAVNEFPTFPALPQLVPVDITATTIETVARRLQGSAGLSGVDAAALRHWLLHFGDVSAVLRETLARFARWLTNEYPPWTAY